MFSGGIERGHWHEMGSISDKTTGFLMFSRGIERDQWHEMGSISDKVTYCCKYIKKRQCFSRYSSSHQ